MNVDDTDFKPLMEDLCGNCFHAGPGDSYECWYCNGDHFIDICSFTWTGDRYEYVGGEECEKSNMERETLKDGTD